MVFAGVIEGQRALHLEGHRSPDYFDAADDLATVNSFLGGADWHVVRHLTDPVGREEARDQDIGVRPVELLGRYSFAHRSYLEASAFPIIQDGGEDAGESKRGRRSQSIEPSIPTKAVVCRSPISP